MIFQIHYKQCSFRYTYRREPPNFNPFRNWYIYVKVSGSAGKKKLQISEEGVEHARVCVYGVQRNLPSQFVAWYTADHDLNYFVKVAETASMENSLRHEIEDTYRPDMLNETDDSLR
jgi:hypothetical protein